jgi:hypothetical protein
VLPYPMPVLWRTHDRHRDLRARLPAELAANTKQDRHVVSQTPCKQCSFLLPICWPHAGNDLAQPNGIGQRADRPFIRSERPLKLLACAQTRNWHRANISPVIDIGTNIKSP